ncbi:TonB-dependent receptor plug domain-containing protein [Sphingosinicella rhizophila]|uniref:TonB-dependent receptor n=1 Tax=Sphingosinicella rhizophila TaxID=3050082 RepID=A0ABU3Q2N4_9SPHN|nr:TonB-dependent receptor [Sphingosinicella sp. GR2756]MDT9597678.1 TonB-dependent receptor [Sphingosinicella sp. GR2756]
MNPLIFVGVAAAAAQQHLPASDDADAVIVVTGAREPVLVDQAPVSATIFDRRQLESLSSPVASDVLRLSPGVSVSSTGPKGTQTQIRIRGAEANHSLLFVDGIRFNDPAAGGEPRFELLTTDSLSRVEIVRGPQSALWGSDALGGVIAVETARADAGTRFSGLGEYGSHDSVRASAQFAHRAERFELSGSAGLVRSDGIDSFGNGGERDGFDNRQASLKAVFHPSLSGEIGVVGHWVEGKSQYDGFDPVTFQRADTLDATENRIFAMRGWGSFDWNGWSLLLDADYLDSVNRNRLGETPLNSTFGQRFTAGGQVSRQLGAHRFTAAVEHEREDFRGRDQTYGGATDQDRSRHLTAFIAAWRADWAKAISTDVTVRHDDFSASPGATTLRAALLVRPTSQWTVHVAYGEGVAQPTFYDLYGFFPGSFIGNPDLVSESARGWEAGVRWRGSQASLGVSAFTNHLRNEIVDTFDSTTFLSSTANVDGKSRRRGIEFDAQYRLAGIGDLAVNYTYLDADDRQAVGGVQLREVRRPRHSGNVALTGSWGAFDWGASLAYVGKRADTDFDLFPARRIILDDYVLASLKLGYKLTREIEAYARVENAFDDKYRDVVGYSTAGRTIYAGLRFRFGE